MTRHRSLRIAALCAVALAFALAFACKKTDEPSAGPPVPPAQAAPPHILEHEPNDVQHPQAIPPRAVVLGQITPGQKGAAKGAADDDWYRVVPGPQTLFALHIELTNAEPVASARTEGPFGPLDVQLEIADRDRNRLLLVHATAGEPASLPSVACFESCFIHLWGTAQAAYQLTVLGAPPAEGQELEPNNRAIDATPLAAGKSIQGTLATTDDEDWYKLTAQARAGEFLRVELSGVPGVRPELELRALSDGALLASFRAAAEGEGIFLRDISLNGDVAPPAPPNLRPAPADAGPDGGASDGPDSGASAPMLDDAGAASAADAGAALPAAASEIVGTQTIDAGAAPAEAPASEQTGAASGDGGSSPDSGAAAAAPPDAPAPGGNAPAPAANGATIADADAGAAPAAAANPTAAAGAPDASSPAVANGPAAVPSAPSAARPPTPVAPAPAAPAAPGPAVAAPVSAADAGTNPAAIPVISRGYYLVIKSSPLTDEKKSPRGANQRAVYTLATALEAGPGDLEAEPNDDAQHATWNSTTRTGYLAPIGDSDWYRVRNEGKSVLHAEVSALSRADLELSIFSAPAHPGDKPVQLARANEGGVREGEVLPAVAIDGDALILVQCAPRELDGVKVRDCEDRDGSYALSIKLAANDGNLEAEPNDDLDHAQPIALPVKLTGTLWPKRDVDQFRFQLDAPRTLSFRLSALRGVDTMLTLRQIKAGKKRTTAEVIGTADASRGEGREEILSVPLKPGAYTIEVASPKRDGSATQTYTLSIE